MLSGENTPIQLAQSEQQAFQKSFIKKILLKVHWGWIEFKNLVMDTTESYWFLTTGTVQSQSKLIRIPLILYTDRSNTWQKYSPCQK